MALLAGCATFAPHSTARPAVDAPVEALDAVVEDGVLVYVAGDGRSIRALDLSTGSERWQAPVEGERPSAVAVIHKLAAHRLLAQLGDRYLALDVSRGVLSTRPAPHHWTFVWRGSGACALRSPCVFQPIACGDGRALGPPLEEQDDPVPFEDSDTELNAGERFCAGQPHVLGAAKGLSIYLATNLRGVEDPAVAVAVDTAGALAWRSAGLGCSPCAPLGFGAAGDGSLCWTTQLGVSEATLRGFDCATGQARFVRQLPIPSASAELVTGWVSEPAGVLFVGGGRAQLIAPDGADRWSRATAPGVLPLPAGLTLSSSYPLALQWVRSVERVSARTGAASSAEDLGARELRIGEDGSPRLLPAGASSDRGGAYVRAPTHFRFTRASSGSRVELGGRVVWRTSGDAWVLGEHWLPQEVVLAIAAKRERAPDVIHLLRAPRPK